MMKNVISFLSRLRRNNNREWFMAHKDEYTAVKKYIDGLAEELIAALGAYDPTVAGLAAKDCTYRIYRDVRFSHNKDPYKTHVGIYVCPGGKKSGYAGYYFHVEPGDDGQGQYFLTAGLYMPEGSVLKSMRDEIYDNGDAIEAAIKKAKGFSVDMSGQLKRLPKGYAPGSPHEEYLKLKDFFVTKNVDEKWLAQDNLAQAIAKEFSKTTEFISILNRAVKYAHEEM